ncbi:tail protein X [Gellertiella hungarica]|uniref:Phage tail protein X n=1 Tax=Gellertiella hungarica TaxID=1572859 RepID=A0A7W6J991_9HYPH|nr:phage tail protein X [Gellertiella hungarica]
MSYVVAFGGERLDRIAKKLMQTERQGTVEALLDANEGLATAAVSGLVPAGTVIRVPRDWSPPAPGSPTVLPWE